MKESSEKKKWARWEKEHKEELVKIKEFEKAGHTPHCACRLVWGDGVCTCKIENSKIYDPYWWMK